MTQAQAAPVRQPRGTPGQVLALVLLAGAMLLGSELLQGWFPHDEGALGQSAERVLRGEVPHRDFDEIYTGLLTYLHAGVFAVLGIGSVAMRVPLMIASLAWLAALYRLLLRFVPPAGAGIVAVTALAWSVPNYPAPLPSWYLLFCATFAALALVRWHESADRRWIALAGAMGGVAFLFKLSGVLVVLGAGLALVATDVGRATSDAVPDVPSPASTGAAFGVAATLVLIAFALARVVGGAGGPEFLRYALPTMAITVALAVRIVRRRASPAVEWRTLSVRILPLLAGAAAPVIIFFAFYAAAGALPALVEGVFVTPFRRVSFAAMRPPPVVHVLLAAPFATLLWLPSARARWGVAASAVAAVLAVTVLYLSATQPLYYMFGWLSAWGLLFYVALETARRLALEPGAPRSAAAQSAITVACVGVALALIEYPFAAPIYTIYSLPLLMVAAVAAVRMAGRVAMQVQAVALGFLLLFGLVRVVPGTPMSMGTLFARSEEIAPLELPRGGIKIHPREAVLYEELIRFVRDTAKGRPIWAGPDSPEVYFLSGLENHTRTLFDFLDKPTDATFPERLRALDAAVVVVRSIPPFSPAFTKETAEALMRDYPHWRVFPSFVVFWR